MMKQRSKKGRGGRRGPKASRPFGMLSNAGDQIVKRITQTELVLATGAGTAIPVTTAGSSTAAATYGVTGGAEWASFAARYQQYRVRAIRVTGKATQPVQSTTLKHSELYRGDFSGDQAPGSADQVFSDELVKTNGTCKDFTHVVTWKRNPNARLWTSTDIPIPIANSFTWVCASPTAPALTTATTYYAFTLEWEVEFRGSQ